MGRLGSNETRNQKQSEEEAVSACRLCRWRRKGIGRGECRKQSADSKPCGNLQMVSSTLLASKSHFGESLRTGAYVKVLFWTDAGNILGLLPPSGLEHS